MTTAKQRDERNAKAAELHLAGVSYTRIAHAIGLSSKSAAYAAVAAGLRAKGDPAPTPADDDLPPSIEDAIETELARLDALLRGQWAEARGGNQRAAETVMKIGEQRLKLLTMLARTQPAPAAHDDDEGDEEVPNVASIVERRAARRAAAEGSAPS